MVVVVVNKNKGPKKMMLSVLVILSGAVDQEIKDAKLGIPTTRPIRFITETETTVQRPQHQWNLYNFY